MGLNDGTCRYFDECAKQAYCKGMCPMHYQRARKNGDPEDPGRVYRGRSLEYNIKHHGWTEVDRVPGLSACWEWGGGRNRSGYGFVYSGGETLIASRVAYSIWVGPIPDGMLICHKCDNPPCINPEHLWPGTPLENTQDMLSKGRAVVARGENVYHAQLSDEQVFQIKTLRKETDLSIKAIAELLDLKVNPSAIQYAASQNGWRHVQSQVDRSQ